MNYKEYDNLKYKVDNYKILMDRIEGFKRDNKILENLRNDKYSNLLISVTGNAVVGGARTDMNIGDNRDRNDIIDVLIELNKIKIKREEEKLVIL